MLEGYAYLHVGPCPESHILIHRELDSALLDVPDAPVERRKAFTLNAHFCLDAHEEFARGLSCAIRHSQASDTCAIVMVHGRGTIDHRNPRGERMNIVVLLIVLLLLFGGGGFYLGGPVVGGGLGGLILLVLVVMLLTGGIGTRA
jgi:hypothetical protein